MNSPLESDNANSEIERHQAHVRSQTSTKRRTAFFCLERVCARARSLTQSPSVSPLICHMISTNGDNGCFGSGSGFSSGVSGTISLLPPRATHYPMHDQPDRARDNQREREWLFISLASLLNKLGSSLSLSLRLSVHASAFSSSSGVGEKEKEKKKKEEEDLIEISEWPNVVARSPPPKPQPNRPTAIVLAVHGAGEFKTRGCAPLHRYEPERVLLVVTLSTSFACITLDPVVLSVGPYVRPRPSAEPT